MRQCAFCHRWMDLNILCWHMRRYHGAKIAFAVKDKNTKVTKKKCEEEVVKVLKQKNLLGETERACYTLLCTVCGRRRLDQEELVTHGRKDHGDSQCLVHKRVFRTAMECELWKNQIANTHRTAWVEGGRCRDGPNVVVFYRCSRVSDEDRHGEVDSRDEEPPLTSCTSFLKEFINDDGTIIVRYCTRHISHGLKITDMPLSYSDKEIIADFIRRGLEPSLIQQVLKKQYSSAMRLHWVTERDIEDVSASIRCQDSLEYMDDSLQGTSTSVEDSKPQFGCYNGASVSAAVLLEETGGYNEENTNNDDSDDASRYRSTESPVQGESMLECASCVKLSERMAELEAIVRRLSERLTELQDSKGALTY
ncbi:hypothetical protein GCK32_008174 [Trichostrongylus colubriformis]|uniref:C2H2-type domain-containing protein n=1 Tax=Trichostrongylus colubriformis TaxID=6319 RepID=A0AAN8ITC9_TRICO